MNKAQSFKCIVCGQEMDETREQIDWMDDKPYCPYCAAEVEPRLYDDLRDGKVDHAPQQ